MQLHCAIKLLPFTNTLNPNHLSQLHQVQTFFFPTICRSLVSFQLILFRFLPFYYLQHFKQKIIEVVFKI